MAKPANVFRWATDALATLVPTSGKQDTGWQVDEMPPARIFNWLANGSYLWQQYLNNLHGEAEFLNKAYTWIGAHTFNAATQFGAGVSPTILGGTEDLLYSAPRARSMFLPLVSQTRLAVGSFTALSQWTLSNDCTKLECRNNGINWYEAPLRLPHGSTLTSLIVRVKPGNSSFTTNMQIELRKVTVNMVGANTSAQIKAAGAEDVAFNMVATAAAGVAELLNIGTVAEVIDNVANYYVLRIGSTDQAGTGNDEILGAQVTFSDARASGRI